MHGLAVVSTFVAILVAAIAAPSGAAEKKATLAGGGSGTFQFPSPTSLWRGKNHDMIGTVEFPATGKKPWPAIILFHGSAGPGYRSESWAAFFRQHGIATMRVDFFTTRGKRHMKADAPVSPGDVTGSVRFLATHPDIDKTRIGLIGFSRGGWMLHQAFNYKKTDTGGVDPAIFVALYPGFCRRARIGADSPDALLLIVNGDADILTRPQKCNHLPGQAKSAGKKFRLFLVPGATHAFDDNRARSFKYRGRMVHIKPDAKATALAREEVLKEVRAAFGM